VAVLADGWSLPGRFWLAFLVFGVPYLIADSERQRR
jgi:hypothetical protein